MKSYAALCGMLTAALLAGGCVSTGKYNEAMADAEAAKAELERARAQKSALEQQVKTMKELNVKFSNEAQTARDELSRIEHGREKERSSLEVKSKELEQKVTQLTAQQRSLRHDYEDVKRHNDTLKSLVARYQKELKDRPLSGGMAGASAAPSAPAPLALPGATAPKSMAPSSPAAKIKPGMTPTMAPSGAPLLNLNKASAGELIEQLGVTKEVADKIVENRPYRLKGELVAKNLVPKDTYDMIKDRVTVSP
ncbi:hypothetical protein YTPLAS18_09690 [Nitrospira sp.]|nr:hypothetical protein YTPLAS18_09690 [Nitrospira sp.]